MSRTATKTASKTRKSSIVNYDQLIPHTSKPLADRRELKIGRGGKAVKPRRFHLIDTQIAELKVEYKETGRIPNAHNKGIYFGIFEALILLGVNEQHSYARVMNKVKSILSSDEMKNDDGESVWDRFVAKDPRNAETGKDAENRLEQNVIVLQRQTGRTPYGRPMNEVGSKVCGFKGLVIDVLVAETGTKYLRLNSKSALPINEAKVRGMGSPAALEAAREAAKAAKKAAKLLTPKATSGKTAKRVKKELATAAIVGDGSPDTAATAAADKANEVAESTTA